MSPYPLTTGRLVIEPLVETDVAAFTSYRRDPDVARLQSWTPDYSEDDARALVAGQPGTELPEPGGWIQLAVRSATDGRLLGDVAVHRVSDQPDTFEVGVTFARSSQGRGFATEALGCVLRFLFDDGSAHRVIAFCDARNEPVARILRRLGFRHESRQVDGHFFKGEWTTLDGYALLAHEPRPSSG